mmetsp:Transcript_7819/g.16974  ORF Transcript_7819/g.16974 Transcript_7819/m.16974 type:complete len:148 (-) Transcript_7819:220-663(-)|eukprot:CAMPEP_0113320226 /NCGR_PEP_ID=MMETSP0010_2-20120614/14118_1 /TAXON_ID=216773 ORGANISM="Corethron hystrix, Strain 308" /NCGR_SAMPLE_ID=MMETSP0010_2 /ASSEMBLY_ACC=CAM_ASM_000155 /LENGTH=147 /DNA_ID=CAMNT_0000177963 /DNA_START=99 /DNA_END=542 /DNA_ORIENTATION=+ /assembly_acc=CAM_ASM_000155
MWNADSCCICLSFRGGMKLLLAWEIFWIWCWFMTSQFMWTGEYNTFNDGGFVTKNVPIILFCTFLSLASVFLTGLYLFHTDSMRTRLGLVLSSLTMLVVAVVFVIGGVPVMWIDILAMGYCLAKTWKHYASMKDATEGSPGGYDEVA